MLDAVVFAIATKKRKAKEMEVAEVLTPQECVNYHQSSAAKKCQNKILCWKTDRKKTMRMVSFQPQLRSQLQASLDAVTSVALSDCQVKEGGFEKGLEIVAASRSKFLHQRNSSCHAISATLISMQRPQCTGRSVLQG